MNSPRFYFGVVVLVLLAWLYAWWVGTSGIVLILSVVVVASALTHLSLTKETERRLREYWTRPCTGRKWLERFPGVAKDDIRAFLQCLTDGFGFDSAKRLKFAPDDRIIDIYRCVYPPGRWFSPIADCCELEVFLMSVERRFGIAFRDQLDTNVTLETLFGMAKSPTATT